MKRNLRPWFAFLCLLSIVSFGSRFTSHAAESTQKDVVYGEAGGQKLQLDIYGADAAQKKPALIFLHGGGWVSGSRADMGAPANGFSQKGYVCFSVSYRLVQGDKNRFPAQIDDVQRAVRWVRAHANEYGVNPDEIGVLGASAGGHLAALLGTTDTRDNSIPDLAKYSSRVQCVVDLYGPTDFTSAIGVQQDDARATGLGGQLVQGFLGPLPENAQNYRDASPAVHVDKKTAPFLIFHGGKDDLVPVAQSQELDEALRKAGIESRLVVFPNAGHAYNNPTLVLQTFALSLDFFDRHLKN